ncbi:MAG: A/G-specific adenine glycosylase [Bacilli bacterium]|nr:A/G-specific adenine glycosylase [Bacilli bacterium]
MNNNLNEIVDPLLNWFQKEKRDLPWRHTNDSYKIWISEIMLQQTRVETVITYYKRFTKALPNLKSLSEVEEDQLLKLWEGLGYYSRAKNLKKCAKIIIMNNKTELPRDYDSLLKLPGIGPYAAGSIGSIAYGLKTPAIDGNVLRVMTRLHEDDRDILNIKVRQDYYKKIQQIMPEDTRNFTESLMELGALICLPKGSPLCERCPVSFFCQSYHHQTMLNYPIKKKEIKRRIEEKTIIILQYQDYYAIQKRKANGLLASMYEFCNISYKLNEEELKKWLKKQKIIFQKVKDLGTTKHIFSHLEWQMNGFWVECRMKPEIDFFWVKKEELKTKYSIPNAYIKYLNKVID